MDPIEEAIRKAEAWHDEHDRQARARAEARRRTRARGVTMTLGQAYEQMGLSFDQAEARGRLARISGMVV